MTSLGRMRSWSRSLVVVAVTNVEGIGLACSQYISGKNRPTTLPLPASSQVQLPRQGKEAQLAVIRLIKQQKVVVALTSNTQTMVKPSSSSPKKFLCLIVVHPHPLLDLISIPHSSPDLKLLPPRFLIQFDGILAHLLASAAETF